MATLTKSTLMTVISKEEKTRKVLTSQGVSVHTPDNAKGNRVTYQMNDNKIAFMQTYGGWVELNSEAKGKFPSDLLGDIANHLRFYKRLVEA